MNLWLSQRALLLLDICIKENDQAYSLDMAVNENLIQIEIEKKTFTLEM